MQAEAGLCCATRQCRRARDADIETGDARGDMWGEGLVGAPLAVVERPPDCWRCAEEPGDRMVVGRAAFVRRAHELERLDKVTNEVQEIRAAVEWRSALHDALSRRLDTMEAKAGDVGMLDAVVARLDALNRRLRSTPRTSTLLLCCEQIVTPAAAG